MNKTVSLMGIQSGEYYMKNNQVIEKDENGVPSIYLDGKFTEWELIEFIDKLRTFRETKSKYDPMKSYSPAVIQETIARAKANGVI